jgi:hypothetical protein
MRSTSTRRIAAALALAVIISSGFSTSPLANASDDTDVTAPLGRGPAGAVVRGVWDDTLLASSDGVDYVSPDGGAHWSMLGSDASAVDGHAWIDYLDAAHAVLSDTESDEDDVTNSRVWIADLSASPANVALLSLPGRDVAAANPTTAIVTGDTGSSALDLQSSTEIPLTTETIPGTDPSSRWTIGLDQAIHVSAIFLADGFNVRESWIDPTPLDGSAGDPVIKVKGEVLQVGVTTDGVEYLLRHKTSGTSTYQLDYCTAEAGVTLRCDVLKSGVGASTETLAWKVGNFAQLKVGNALYFSELTRNSTTGKLPAAIKVTGINPKPNEFNRTEFTRIGRHGRPIVTDTTPITGGVFEVGKTGKAVRVTAGPTRPVQPNALSLSATHAAGIDERGVPGTAWLRGLGDFGTELVLSHHAKDALVSVGRTLLNSSEGLILTDQGKQVGKLQQWSWAAEMSGPYVLGFASAKAKGPTVLSGTKVIPFGKYEYPFALFGSLVASLSFPPGSWELTIFDVASGKPVKVKVVPIDDFQRLKGVYLWGDNVAVSGVLDADADLSGVQITNFRTGDQVWARSFTDGGSVLALGDGAAILETGDVAGWQVLNLASGELAPLDDAGDATPALDGSGSVLYATRTSLVVHQLPFAGGSEPRALWTSAPASFNSFAGESAPWKLAVDATKALPGGSLVIRGKGAIADQTVTLPVAASTDGSLRVAWDGAVAGGIPAPVGSYSWNLEGFGDLKAINGSAAVAGTLTVTNTKVPYPQATPVIDHPQPVMDSVLTVNPGTSPSDATVSVQWYRGSTAIPGAVNPAYTMTTKDVGKTIKVKVSFAGSGRYLSTSKFSKATSKVAKATITPAPVPQLDDTTPTVGELVSATADTWGPAPVSLAYQWYEVNSSGKASAITAATAAAFTPTGAQVGDRLKLKVTGSKAGYTTRTVYSALTATVVAG